MKAVWILSIRRDGEASSFYEAFSSKEGGLEFLRSRKRADSVGLSIGQNEDGSITATFSGNKVHQVFDLTEEILG